MRKLFVLLLIVFVLCGCSGSSSSLATVDKVFYSNNENEDTSSLYIVYTVKSDEKKDRQYGSPATLKSPSGECKRLSDSTIDNFLKSIGYDTAVHYETIYAGGSKTITYVWSYVINKKFIGTKDKLTLTIPNSENDVSVSFTMNDDCCVQFTNNLDLQVLLNEELAKHK